MLNQARSCLSTTHHGHRWLPAAAIAISVLATGITAAAPAQAAPRTDASIAATMSLPADVVTSPADAADASSPAPAAVTAVPLQARAAKQAAMVVLTTKSPATRDLIGYAPSMYRGHYFHTSQESFRHCVIVRESEAHYSAISHTGTYRGAYQISPTLARGATWMMLPEHEAELGRTAALNILTHLRSLPISKWPRYWQDAAFYTVLNYKHTNSGKRAWAGGRWHC